jgi:hypothetical protein
MQIGTSKDSESLREKLFAIISLLFCLILFLKEEYKFKLLTDFKLRTIRISWLKKQTNSLKN